ncbi:MAG: bifunctional phosphopantothenoylcysteine decarboxylase/phosphopantothenate--cysteine ligase CoaBC [Flavobacteriaceae bacterium]
MHILSGKKILVGITAGIAAYKSAFLVRLLKKNGADVKVIMTPDALDFVTPLTLSTLSGHPVYYNLMDDEGHWHNHVELGLWADLFVIAPATANTLSKMASGAANNLLLTTYLSAKCPVYFAPAMDLDMYKHRSTKQSIEQLIGFGNKFIKPGDGELASGLSGEGRMAEPEEIIRFICQDILAKLPFHGQRVLITAGPTYEAIDPVRFIGNRSSGKMGYALAEEALRLGAEVVLVSGPTYLSLSHPQLKLIQVRSTEDMFQAVQKELTSATIIISSAAVSDYKPKHQAQEKIKKSTDAFTLDLEKTQDILKYVGDHKTNQYLIGFALETENAQANAQAKLHKKNLDAIVLNQLDASNQVFGSDQNKVSIFTKTEQLDFEAKPKNEVARDIFKFIASNFLS